MAKAQQEDMIQEAPALHCLGKMVPIEQVRPNPENPNVHPDEQLEVLADVLRVNGWRQPIVVSKLSGLVVKGHGRLQTARFMKLKEIPVDFQDYADAQAEYQDMIADNRVSQLAYVDAFKLGSILKKMSADGQKHLGYSSEEIQLFSAAEYVAPEQTDRKFVLLETLKLTREAKAIIGGAVQKYCLRMGKEEDWGEALSAICMAWQVVVLPSMPQLVMEKKPAPAPTTGPATAGPGGDGVPATPTDAASLRSQARAAKKAARRESEPPAQDGTAEVSFRVKYVASTSLSGENVTVVRTDDDSFARCYTKDAAVRELAEKLKGKKVLAVVQRRDGQCWLVQLEEVS